MTPTLQSYLAGRWLGQRAEQPLRSAINGRPVESPRTEVIDFGEAIAHARSKGLPASMALDFQQRTSALKALARYLNVHKEQRYAVSSHTGATRAVSWVDIDGGSGTSAGVYRRVEACLRAA